MEESVLRQALVSGIPWDRQIWNECDALHLESYLAASWTLDRPLGQRRES